MRLRGDFKRRTTKAKEKKAMDFRKNDEVLGM
jgi:hypothetical protein